MKTVTLWNVPVTVAKTIVEEMRRDASAMLTDPNASIEDVRDYLRFAQDVEEAIRNEEEVDNASSAE